MNLFKVISLSVKKLLAESGHLSNTNSQLKTEANYFKWFPLVVDNLTNITDTSQLAFILGVNAKFEVAEELASVNSLCGTNISEYVFKEIEKIHIQYNLKWNLLRCVTTDGDKNMCKK